MAEYIDLDTPFELEIAWGNTYKPYTSTLRELLDVNHIPYTAADVQPVRHGRWEKNDDGIMVWWECSECHRNAWYDGDNLFDYCPDCGAKMDGGET